MTTPNLTIPENIVQHFKSADVEVIVAKKSTEQQTRAIAASKPTKVSLTAEEAKKLCKDAGVEYYPGYEGRVLQYTMSDETVDRYGDIVKADGCDMVNYKKNAVIMTFHNYKQFPVGCCIKSWVDKSEKKVKGWVLIVDNQVDPSGVSDTAFRMASSGYMKAGSVGFMPKTIYRPTEEERKTLGMGNWGVMFKAWELMEFSLCGVPANPNAVQESVERGVIQQRDVDLLHKELPTDEFADFFKSIEEVISKEQVQGQQTDVTSKDTDSPVAPAPAASTITLSLVELTKLVEESVAKAVAASSTQKTVPPVTKAGAVLSKKNKELVTNAMTQMSEAVTALKDLLAAADKGSESSTEEETSTPAEEGKEADGPDLYEAQFDEILADLKKSF